MMRRRNIQRGEWRENERGDIGFVKEFSYVKTINN